MIQILTGWGTQHACAAAVALHCYADAEVVPVSKWQFPRYLDRVLQAAEVPEAVLILGIAFDDHMAMMIPQLIHAAIDLTLISTDVIPKQVTDLNDRMHLVIPGKKREKDYSLARLTAKALEVPLTDIQPVLKLAEVPVSERSDALNKRVDLLEAAAWEYRVNGRDSLYIEAIKTLGGNLSLSDSQEQLVSLYERYGQLELRGESKEMKAVWADVKRIGAHRDCSVLIQGESGTGKELVASALHLSSERRHKPFIALNCASIPRETLASELFGHVKGAFTGAIADRKGAFRSAHGGTLFLDEIGEMPPTLQATLLRVLETKRVTPLGSDKPVKVDVRILAATHRDLWKLVQEDDAGVARFRLDLFFRLKALNIYIPPLRDRRSDIRDIANSWLYRQGWPLLTKHQVNQLKHYHWPGNGRQLINVLTKANVLGIRDYSQALTDEPDYALVAEVSEASDPDMTSYRLDDAVRAHCLRVYVQLGENKSATARELGVNRNTLLGYLKKWGVA